MSVCFDSAHKRFWYIDHFVGAQIKDEWTSAGDAGGSSDVVDLQAGGIARLTTNNDDDDEWYIRWGNIHSLLMTKKVCAESKVKLSSAANINDRPLLLFVDGANQIGFRHDTDAGQATWYIFCRDGGATTSLDSGFTVDTDWHIFRIQCHTHGGNHVHYFIDDFVNEVTNSPIDTNIPTSATDYLEPFFQVQTRVAAAAKSMDIDYIGIRQGR